jgi:pantoate kinase
MFTGCGDMVAIMSDGVVVRPDQVSLGGLVAVVSRDAVVHTAIFSRR